MTHATVRLAVLAGDDPRRIEQLTADLETALKSDRRLHETGVTITHPSVRQRPHGKGVVQDAVAVLQASAPIAGPALGALATAVVTWCARDRRATVRVTEGERSIEISGDPSGAQQAVLDRFLGADRPSSSDA